MEEFVAYSESTAVVGQLQPIVATESKVQGGGQHFTFRELFKEDVFALKAEGVTSSGWIFRKTSGGKDSFPYNYHHLSDISK